MNAPVKLRIDFVSDVACPWCAIGLAGLQHALAGLHDDIAADIHLQPFELNPAVPAAGEDAGERIMREYGIDEATMEANRAVVREHAAAVGIAYNMGHGSRAWNTFDAHRLLHWAATRDAGKALALKQALFRAYFTDNENVSDHAVLERLAAGAGLDAAEARRVLDSGAYADEVRAQERRYQMAGIHSVPATIVNGQYLIPGGQPAATFEHALREIASKLPAA